MVRYLAFWLPMAAVLPPGGIVWGQPTPGSPPLRYELMINGESFLVEANRLHKLPSKQKPGVTYEVALRVAPTQHMKLNSVRFEYDWLSKVEDNRQRVRRCVRLSHELGFTMLITELGKPLEPKARDETLSTLATLVGKTFAKTQVEKLQQGKPHTRKFGGATGRGVMIRYRDRQDLGHTCLVYVLVGPKFAVSCVVEYLDADGEDVLPLVKKTLDSFRALD